MRLIATLLTILLSTGVMAQVTFRSDFNSGSLGVVEEYRSNDSLIYRITSRQDPINPLDTTAERNSRWFYMLASGVAGVDFSIEIPHTDMQRCVYSYDNKTFHRFSDVEIPQRNGRITKRFTNDSVYIAYSTPYDTARNDAKLREWGSSPKVRRFTLGGLLKGMVITDNPEANIVPDANGRVAPTREDRAKRVVYIHGRIHPSETPASWHLESLVDHIIEDRDGVLRNTIFYIIPFTNPTGVEAGCSRTNVRGVNLEVNYNHPEAQTEPEVIAIKGLLTSLDESGLRPDIALNMHSQSTPMLTYWVHTAGSTSAAHNNRSMLFARLTTQSNPLFRWRNVSYSTLKSYFLEGWIYRQFRGKTTALTYETPYSFYDRNPNGEWVTGDNLCQQARHLLNAITDMLGTGSQSRIMVSEPRRAVGLKHVGGSEYLHLGGSHLRARRSGATVKYRTGMVARGEYDVYRWVVDRCTTSERHDRGRWVYVGRHTQRQDGKFRYEIISRYKGETQDQIMLINCSCREASLLPPGRAVPKNHALPL